MPLSRANRFKRLPNVIRREPSAQSFFSDYVSPAKRILNLGSGAWRPSGHVINVDIQPDKNIDVRADAHQLPFRAGAFDIVIATAMLQYCHAPHRVASECARVLVTGGMIYVEAPFVQAYCVDTKDRFRFTRDGLMGLFEFDFAIECCSASIGAPSALAHFLQGVFRSTGNRVFDHFIRLAMSICVLPLKALPSRISTDTHAGAFYLIGRKR